MKFDLSKWRYWILLIIFTVISYGTALIVSAILDEYIMSSYIKILIEAPGFFGLFFLLTRLFDKYLWKWKIWKFLGIVDFPNLQGVYQGTFTSSYIDPSTGVNAIGGCELNITQTATSIVIKGKFNQSDSISTVSQFAFNQLKQEVCLYYFFRNQPKAHANLGMHAHEGCMIASYNEQSKKLDGEYYSGRDRNNFGSITVTKI